MTRSNPDPLGPAIAAGSRSRRGARRVGRPSVRRTACRSGRRLAGRVCRAADPAAAGNQGRPAGVGLRFHRSGPRRLAVGILPRPTISSSSNADGPDAPFAPSAGGVASAATAWPSRRRPRRLRSRAGLRAWRSGRSDDGDGHHAVPRRRLALALRRPGRQTSIISGSAGARRSRLGGSGRCAVQTCEARSAQRSAVCGYAAGLSGSATELRRPAGLAPEDRRTCFNRFDVRRQESERARLGVAVSGAELAAVSRQASVTPSPSDCPCRLPPMVRTSPAASGFRGFGRFSMR